MERVLVVGAGFMGAGIAQVCAQSGYLTHLMDVEREALEKAHSGMQWSLHKLWEKGLLKDSPQTILKRVQFEQSLSRAANVMWVIEAAPEVCNLKQEIFKELDRLASVRTILATNTSSIPITTIAQGTQHPERVMGLHFFGPVPLMDLVEVINGEKTSTRVLQRGVGFVRSLGKTPIIVRKDIPGFVMNRIFASALREAIDLVAQGVVSETDIDFGMRRGFGWNAGPFEIVDNAGLDTWVLIERFFKTLGEDKLVPLSDLLERMVNEGRLGRKVGKGFYRYSNEGKRLPWENEGSEE